MDAVKTLNAEDNPLLSVIVPVYNAGKYLHRCIDSILNQDYISIELLLVNDGSSDASATICDEYVRVDKRVRCFHQENKGVNVARNVGLDLAAGEYITFVDADDEIAPDTFLMNMRILIEQNDIDILQYPEIGVHGSEEKLWANYPSQPQTIEGLNNMIIALLGENAMIPGGLCGMIYKKKIWNTLRLRTDMRFCEDMIMMPLIFENAHKIYISTFGSYRYYWNDNSACHSEYTPAKCFDTARSAYGLYKVCEKYQVNVLNNWNNAVMACINAWSFCGPKKELRAYLKDLKKNEMGMHSKMLVKRFVKVARWLSPLKAAWLKWFLVRVLFLNRV